MKALLLTLTFLFISCGGNNEMDNYCLKQCKIEYGDEITSACWEGNDYKIKINTLTKGTTRCECCNNYNVCRKLYTKLKPVPKPE